MLFSTTAFLFSFLPRALAAGWLTSFGPYWLFLLTLTGASAYFYAAHVPAYLWLLGLSAAGNYAVAMLIEKGRRRWLYLAAIAFNLVPLGYFKYWDFVARNVDRVLGLPFTPSNIVLPLAISFITFEQIAFLSDLHAGRVERGSPLRYAAFISFFPKLIAGPIIRYTEMLPQFRAGKRPSLDLMVTGLCIFSIGLFKKVAFADQLAPSADRIFGLASGQLVSGTDAALAITAYAAQIYFDFSGYSDMAIGLACMLGLTLPVNFFSPYKATSIIEFWRRWHITLSRFLRDYLYIPLGGNRGGTSRTYVNLFLVMTLGGLWHGAGFAFIIWGALHGVALILNHAWNSIRPAALAHSRLISVAGWAVTMVTVLFGWVFFRAVDLATSRNMLASLLTPWTTSTFEPRSIHLLAFCWLLIVACPNTAQLFRFTFLLKGGECDYLRQIPAAKLGLVALGGTLLFFSLVIMVSGTPNAFIYFQF
ncbi:MBOAT family protein [Bradyrhizobium japonicum]|uniref:MBOAT family O-acyltransferase n=1 Tax=Bradyrhizobium japonicum TaxID=375 RepID=UPI001BA4D241|nr:MBOAT family O-acyltransferase [Bradyrhizobium japonicum]MBR0730657.1 MBOAT family protein [Bradyrhizobium japonicum]